MALVGAGLVLGALGSWLCWMEERGRGGRVTDPLSGSLGHPGPGILALERVSEGDAMYIRVWTLR